MVPLVSRQRVDAANIPTSIVEHSKQVRVHRNPELTDRHDPARQQQPSSLHWQQQFDQREEDQWNETANRIDRTERKCKCAL